MTRRPKNRRHLNTTTCSLGALVFLASQSCLAGTFAGVLEPSLRVGSPSAHRYLGDRGTSTTSWIEKTSTWTSDGTATFTYFIDSEQGDDELAVSVDGEVRFRVSGREKTGRGYVNVTAGSHAVRFAYQKSGNTDVGLDRTWIDDVQFVASTHVFASHPFEAADSLTAGGWSTGGDVGGWDLTYGPDIQAFRRPIAMAFAGYQPTGHRAAIARRFHWPTATQNGVSVGYFVDSEPDNDALRVLVDGSEAFRISGANRRGIARIPILTGGEHEITIEYTKDAGVDGGRDEARIDFVLPTANGAPFSTSGFASATAGEAPPGWEVPSWADSGGWEVVSLAVTRADIAQLDVARSVDGEATNDEYLAGYWFAPNHTATLPAKRPGLRMAASSDGTMYFNIELPESLGIWFMSGGQLDLLLDAEQPKSSLGLGCGPLGSSAGSYARRLVFSTGVGPVLTDLETYQQVGTCADLGGEAWRDAVDAEHWAAASAMTVDEDTGTVSIEFSILPVRPTGLEVTDPIGFQLTVDGTLPGVGPQTILRLPWMPNRLLDWRNAATWQPIFFRTGELTPSSGV